MEIFDGSARMNRRERALFAVAGRTVPLEQLDCFPKLRELTGQHAVLAQEYEALRDYMPGYTDGFLRTGYRAALHSAERDLNTALRIGSEVLTYETERYLAGKADVGGSFSLE